MEVQLHLVGKSLLTRTCESVGRAELIDDRERREDSVLLIYPYTID
jgi:hypothetical protein